MAKFSPKLGTKILIIVGHLVVTHAAIIICYDNGKCANFVNPIRYCMEVSKNIPDMGTCKECPETQDGCQNHTTCLDRCFLETTATQLAETTPIEMTADTPKFESSWGFYLTGLLAVIIVLLALSVALVIMCKKYKPLNYIAGIFSRSQNSENSRNSPMDSNTSTPVNFKKSPGKLGASRRQLNPSNQELEIFLGPEGRSGRMGQNRNQPSAQAQHGNGAPVQPNNVINNGQANGGPIVDWRARQPHLTNDSGNFSMSHG